MGILFQRITKQPGRAPDGATIAVPNDGSNESRAIKLLADNGLITLAETEDLYNLTSIAENPHNFEITELDAANLPRSLDDVDAAVINGNYALEANLNPEKDALAAELADSDESYKYINYLVVKEGNEESTKTEALIAALQNDDVKNTLRKSTAVPLSRHSSTSFRNNCTDHAGYDCRSCIQQQQAENIRKSPHF